MDITSVEVIKRPGVAIEVVTGEKVELTYGDTLKVNTSFDFRGAAGTVTLYGAIGTRGWAGFNEILHGQASIKLPDSRTVFTPCEGSVNITITSDIDPGTDYDLYVKIKENPEAGMPEVDDAIDIVGMPPTYELLEETIYPYAYIYNGDAEVSTFTFKTPAFVPSEWASGKLTKAAEEEVRKQGGRVLELRVYVDKTPLLWTDWQIEVIGTPLAEGVGTAVGIPIWVAILIAALAIAGLVIIITWAIKTIHKEFEHHPGLSDVKPGWDKETLIKTIHDSEEYWKRTLTPAETLEGMSEDELRDYLDKMAEEEVPSGISWWPIAIGAGVVVLGVGAALATRKR